MQERLQIFCIGASTTYGVGGSKGGWPDLIKQRLHQKMYGSDLLGEMHEVYNLGVPGATIGDMLERVEVILRTSRKPGRKVITVLQGGANNAKAIDSPENFVSTPEEYKKEVLELLKIAQTASDEVICLGLCPMDQSKVMPIIKDKEKNKKVYFPNDRIAQFEKVLGGVASSLGIMFLPLFDEAEAANWSKKYQFQGGIHPNDLGHEWLFQKVWPQISSIVA